MEKMRRLFTGAVQKAAKLGIVRIALLAGAAVLAAAAGLFLLLKPEADIAALSHELEYSTKIYDDKGELAVKVTANKSEGIPIGRVPDHVKNAVVAIEDHRFYEHGGIDYKGIMRAMVTNIKAGSVVEGGSTITQQLIKISLLEPDRTFKRKAEEFFLAKEAEKEYSKDEILEMYLNQIYFGHGAWGINKAARIYFDKQPEELNISEAALLAGIINLPGKLDPFINMEGAMKRRNLVLSRMEEHGFISSDEAEKANAETIQLAEGGGTDPLKGKYPYYVDHVLTEASNQYGIELDELLTGGYQIYTGLDQDLQQGAEEVYAEESNFPKGIGNDPVQSGMIMVDPKTGKIKALIGGRGKHQFLGYNRATQLKTSPGSSIKPLAVYAPAIKEGYDITDELKDEKMDFGDYTPSNLNGQYKGSIPMFEALIQSANVPAVWLLNEIGIQKGMDSLQAFGLPLEEEDRNLTIALGGMKEGVSPQDMAEAYTVFSNGGKKAETHAIVKIEDRYGNEVAAWSVKEEKVLEKEVVDKMNTMLLGVVEHGTGANGAVGGHEIAGKTGSTQVPIKGLEKGVKDQWFVGYTPSLTAAVWAGYDKTDKDHYLTTHSSQGAAIIFQKLMAKALEGKQSESFNVPDLAPLIEDQKRKEERQEKYKFWYEQRDRFEEGLKKWRDRLFNSNSGEETSGGNQPQQETSQSQEKPEQKAPADQQVNEGDKQIKPKETDQHVQPSQPDANIKPKQKQEPNPAPKQKPEPKGKPNPNYDNKADPAPEQKEKPAQKPGTAPQPKPSPNPSPAPAPKPDPEQDPGAERAEED